MGKGSLPAAAGRRFKESSRRRRPMLPLGRLKYTTRRRSAVRPTPTPADPLESDETNRLRQKLDELALEGDKLDSRERRLKKKVKELRRKITVTQTALSDWEKRSNLSVIPFVAAINQANRYFDLKNAAIKKFDTQKKLLPLDILGILRDDEKLNSKFNKFGDLELVEAAIAISDELRAKQQEKHQGDIQNSRFEKDPALCRPIYNLVFRTRKQGYVMDQDPVVEHEKIMKSRLYDDCFLLEVPPENYSTTIKEAYESYTKFWSKYVKAASGAEPFVGKAEDADYTFPFTGTDPHYMFRTGSGVNLMKKLEALYQQLDKQLLKKKQCDAKCEKVSDQIRLTGRALWQSEIRSALPYSVIPFVAKIEKANRYFEFKKVAKEKYRQNFSIRPNLLPFNISDILRDDTELNSEFIGLTDGDFHQAAAAIYYELNDEIRRKRPELCVGDLPNCRFKKRKDSVLIKPVYKLVFQAREQRRVMDEDPIVELEKIMKSDLDFYDTCFNMSGQPVGGLATTLMEAKTKYSKIWSTYFKASQGIKRKASDQPGARKGKQLASLARVKRGKVSLIESLI